MCDPKRLPQLHWRRASKKTLVTKEWLEAHFHLSHYEAAKKLEISASYFKKLCRFHGVAKWPYRQVALQKKLLDQNTEKTRLKTSTSGCKRKKEESPGSSDSETENDVKRQAIGVTHFVNATASSPEGSTNEHGLDELRVLAACSLERNGVSAGPSDMCMHNDTSDESPVPALAMWLTKHIGSPDMPPQMPQPKQCDHVFPNITPPHSTIPVNPTPLEPTRGPNDLFQETLRRWSNSINDSMSSRPVLPSLSDSIKETMLQHRSPVLPNMGTQLQRPVDVLALVASEAHAESEKENRAVCDRSDALSVSSNHSNNCSETSNDSASTLTFDVQSMCN